MYYTVTSNTSNPVFSQQRYSLFIGFDFYSWNQKIVKIEEIVKNRSSVMEKDYFRNINALISTR